MWSMDLSIFGLILVIQNHMTFIPDMLNPHVHVKKVNAVTNVVRRITTHTHTYAHRH